ncbi:MAG: Gfo/Idh/MocA family oxidoreductase [Gemmatimonadetes bacterium]|nr:Gfo/Idh/MocA family oxidoreductase [Gemmatimonadota bacterium]MBT5055036.1 Gfo/Idh/MocA family oxidoreductase [Gemmatimonadota bacterium]MBT5143335.1 Gfo/Idh/MocA family oxidoreductase [Gemmatimonadota bacterium]MBT5586731.1 Gfo/Idh/MocA family oxidoreductase [Gemmatimonadota bacterium]MBT5963486.1 Gfo/Idh/MocA family oxidoreductase [Gemmatimonadota bacterium]
MIRLLCVGLGGMGHHDWNAAVDCGGFEAVGGVDISAEARATFTEKTGAPTFTDWTDAIAHVEADAALISTPDRFHAPLALNAFDAGLDVICEKPMAENFADARRMHHAALEHGKMLMIHHQLRWHPTWFEARRQVSAGAIGTVRRVDFHFSVHSDVCLRGYRSELPHLVFQDLSIHHFDLIRYLVGSPCVSVYARDWVGDEPGLTIKAATDAVAILEFAGPVTASYTATVRELIDPVGYTCQARVHGTEGEILVGSDQVTVQTRAAHAAGTEAVVIAPDAPEVSTWAAFAQAIESREPTLTHSADNLQSLALMFAAMKSSETGQIVEPETL